MKQNQEQKDNDLGGAFGNFANMILRPTVVFEGIIKEVDETAFTATVQAGESLFYEVPLRVLISNQSSVVEIPKINTTALLCFRNINMQTPQILLIQESEKILFKCNEIIFNDGTLGGMVKAKELKDQSEKDKAVLDALLNIINGPAINEPGNGAPSALQIALKAALAGKSPGEWDNLENEKITQ